MQLEGAVCRVVEEAGVEVEGERFELIPEMLDLLTDVLRNRLCHL
jgi:hypothetical protein